MRSRFGSSPFKKPSTQHPRSLHAPSFLLSSQLWPRWNAMPLLLQHRRRSCSLCLASWSHALAARRWIMDHSNMIHVSSPLWTLIVVSELYEAHHFDRPIDHCDEVAQVAVFLGVISVILFGLSQRSGEFFLGVISVILTLVFKLLGTKAETLRDRTLKQIPKNMKAALGRFNFVCHLSYLQLHLQAYH